MKHLVIIICFFLSAGQHSSCQQKPPSTNKADQKISDSASNDHDTSLTDIQKEIRDEYPLKFKGWTNDFDGLFTNSQISYLDSVISKLENETKVEIAIVTVDSSFVSAQDFDKSITEIGNIWGVGKKELQNGIVIGISSSLRKIRISTGYGMEKILTDAICSRIIDEIMIPEFKNAHYFKGTSKALDAITKYLK